MKVLKLHKIAFIAMRERRRLKKKLSEVRLDYVHLNPGIGLGLNFLSRILYETSAKATIFLEWVRHIKPLTKDNNKFV